LENYPGWMDNQRWKKSLPPEIWQEVRESLDHYQKIWFFNLSKYGWDARRKKLKQLLDAGVRFLMGSDSGACANPHTDAAWREMEILVELGMSPMEEIMAATRLPAQVLGAAESLGTIEGERRQTCLSL
jgi:imidazolonepropionase-like amidohydrolase